MLSTLFNIPLSPDPAAALLNLKPSELTQPQFKLLLQLTTAAEQIIAKTWKTPTLCNPAVKKQGHARHDKFKNRSCWYWQSIKIRSPLNSRYDHFGLLKRHLGLFSPSSSHLSSSDILPSFITPYTPLHTVLSFGSQLPMEVTTVYWIMITCSLSPDSDNL